MTVFVVRKLQTLLAGARISGNRAFNRWMLQYRSACNTAAYRGERHLDGILSKGVERACLHIWVSRSSAACQRAQLAVPVAHRRQTGLFASAELTFSIYPLIE